MSKISTKLFTLILLVFMLAPAAFNYAQVQRNPVIEACTGTWCQWCPCGHDIIDNILVSMPNAIAIEYHGPVGSGDPWAGFNGNAIIGLLGFSGYPTGVVDRTGAPLSRNAWPGAMNTRYNIPAAVDITIDKQYNKVTRELNVTVHSTAQSNLTGEYRLSFLILESGLIYNQAGNSSCTGGTNYVHNHVVRSMINGAAGDLLNEGGNPWNSGTTLSKSIQFTVPNDYVADNCELVAFVYKVSSPLNTGEIQQGQKWPLVSPDYVANIAAVTPDVITENNAIIEFTASVENQGLLDDMYYIEASIDGPAGWTGEFETSNGTVQFGQIDSVNVSVGSTEDVLIRINPNGVNGFGNIILQFTSANDPGVIAIARMRAVTTGGVDILIIDAGGEAEHSSAMVNSLTKFYEGTYGVVSKDAVKPDVVLSEYYLIGWVAGNKVPVFDEADIPLLEAYLDQGGRLFITGQDIGADIFEVSGQSHFAADFYHNYLHADYVANAGPSFFLTGIAGDPIGDGLAFATNTVYPRSHEQIAPIDADASPVIQFLQGPLVSSIKAKTADYAVVYLGFGLEQLDSEDVRDTLVTRSVRWLMEDVTVGVPGSEVLPVNMYSLQQNYPNPFNPATNITYSVADAGHVQVKVYDIMGGEVATLVNTFKQPGSYTVSFDASSLSSGMYIYKISAGNFTASKKMIILK